MAELLLVDDDHDVAEVFREVLGGNGHAVRTARTGREGLLALRAAPLPDLVILDVDMPIMSGPAMAHQMFLQDAGEERIPIILVSARHDLPQIAARVGTPYFLQKTGDVGAFLRVIERALSERHAPSCAGDALLLA